MPITLHPLFREDPRRRLVGVGRDEGVIDRLRRQYAQARLKGERLAQIFYNRLFAEYPAVRPMFRSDPDVQQRKLMDSLDAVMLYLDKPAEQESYLRQMGARHAGYGALPEHYAIVSGLLTDAIVEVLEDKGDANTRQDWLDAFNLISEQMLAGVP